MGDILTVQCKNCEQFVLCPACAPSLPDHSDLCQSQAESLDALDLAIEELEKNYSILYGDLRPPADAELPPSSADWIPFGPMKNPGENPRMPAPGPQGPFRSQAEAEDDAALLRCPNEFDWKTPFSVFLWFFLPFAQRIVMETNDYARVKRSVLFMQRLWRWKLRRRAGAQNTEKERDNFRGPCLRPWKPLQLYEIFLFFALLIIASATGHLNQPTREWWSSNAMLQWGFAKSFPLSGVRFHMILEYLHLADIRKKEPYTSAAFDPLAKVRWALKKLRDLSQRAFVPAGSLSLDEMGVRYYRN